MKVKLGDMRERISILSRSPSNDGMGGHSGTLWPVYTTLWAMVVDNGGTEVVKGNRRQAESRFVVTVYYRTDLLESMRVRWGAHLMDIKSISPSGVNRQFITLDCLETALQ